MENKKPEHLLVFKIIGFIGIAVGIFGFILSMVGFGDFESNNFMIGGFLACFGIFVGVLGLSVGFRPDIARMSAKTAKYIQQENKEDLKDIVNTSAEISSDAITTVTKAVKDGLNETVYCKHCGSKIDADSKFCKSCGKEQ